MTEISAVILAKDERVRLKNALDSVSWAEEIIVLIDNGSVETTRIAEEKATRVIERDMNENFAEQRNLGLKVAAHDWILFVDADEVISEELSKEILDCRLDSTPYVAFSIPRKDYLWSKQLRYGDLKDTKIIRLGKRSAGKWKRRVHEYWDIEDGVGTMHNPILHTPHRTLREFVASINRYSRLHAIALKEEDVSTNIIEVISYPVGKFLSNYLFKLGFMDGTHGFIHAAIMSLHSFLARSHLWLLRNAQNDIRKYN